MSDEGKAKTPVPAASRTAAVDAFLRQVAATPARQSGQRRGRLIFAMDATASRQPSWDRACRLQGEMFEATAGLGGLEIQLVFYRGFAECRASKWMTAAADLHRAMQSVRCAGGTTQIARVLRHAQGLVKNQVGDRVDALVFVGDAMEESFDELAGLAGELGLLGVPVFLFQEGEDTVAAHAFREIARLSRGAYCAFDAGSADQLRALLRAVAVFVAGGRPALAAYGKRTGGSALLLARQLGGT